MRFDGRQRAFGRDGRLSDLNSIDILGEIGVIASYRIQELIYIKQYAQAEFIFGECYCPILEDPDDDCVKNDREKLIDTNPKTRALLKWIAEQVDALGKQIEAEDSRERKVQNLRLSDEFNKILNTWKNQFMDKLLADVLGGPEPGNTAGGHGFGGSGGGTQGKSHRREARAGKARKKEVEVVRTQKKGLVTHWCFFRATIQTASGMAILFT